MLVQSRSNKGRFAFIWELMRLWKPPQHPFKGRNPVQIDRPAVLRRAKARCWVTWTRSSPSDLKLTLPCLILISSTRPFNKRQLRQQRGEMSLTVNPSSCTRPRYSHVTGAQKTHRLLFRLQPEFRKCWDVCKILIKGKIKEFQITWANNLFTIEHR